jgi:PPM family protein phosphatase
MMAGLPDREEQPSRRQQGGPQVFWEQSVQCATETDIGLRRKNNEDAACVHICKDELQWRQSGHLFVVADGMGGHAVGELASRIAVETVPHTFLKSEGDPRSTLVKAILAANQAIHSRGTQNVDFHHMGTTCTALALSSRGAIVGHVGDSRAYRIRRDRIDQLTFDHSLEWELERQNGGKLEGILDLSQHKNIITRSLGPEETIEVDVEGPYLVLPGDTFVLCSDGLSNQVEDQEIGAIVRDLSPKQAARLLVHLANIRGGPDNSTVVVVRVGELPANVVPNVPEEPDSDHFHLGWSWLIGFWIAGMAVVAGVAMLALGHPIKGGLLTGLAAVVLALLTVGAIRQQRRMVRQNRDMSRTNLWRPHRTAVSLSSQQLFERLTEIEIELQRSAQEDGWNVNWKEHASAVQAARQAHKEKRFARGVRDVSRAIDVIMAELPRSNAHSGAGGSA